MGLRLNKEVPSVPEISGAPARSWPTPNSRPHTTGADISPVPNVCPLCPSRLLGQVSFNLHINPPRQAAHAPISPQRTLRLGEVK